MRELVDAGAAAPGEIVLLFAAGTDAERYEAALRAPGAADLPRDRAAATSASSRSSTCSSYLRLLHNRYDDEALATVLASPFVGVSNDALVLIRRHAGEAAALHRDRALAARAALARATSGSCARSSSGTSGSSPRRRALSLERLCEEIVSAHDYDLAVLAQWDGKRRYANLRKLMRLARSYEELRGADIEGFVRFIRDQEAVGASQLEAVSEEEGADAVRLLTIHAAKGLEFKVVIVADAGRDTGGRAVGRRDPRRAPTAASASGSIDPTSGKRKRRLRLRGGARGREARGRAPSGCASTTSR